MAVSQPDPATVFSELESADRLLVQQVLRPIANEYRIAAPGPELGDVDRPLLVAFAIGLDALQDR